MDSQDLHELAISYCETIFAGKSPSPKQYIKAYFKAIRSFEQHLTNQLNESIGGIEVIEEIKSNISAYHQNEDQEEDDILN